MWYTLWNYSQGEVPMIEFLALGFLAVIILIQEYQRFIERKFYLNQIQDLMCKLMARDYTGYIQGKVIEAETKAAIADTKTDEDFGGVERI